MIQSIEKEVEQQVETVLAWVKGSQDYDDMFKTYRLWKFARNLWYHVDPLAEELVKENMRLRLQFLINEDEKYLSVLRKNAYTRATTEKNVERMRNMLTEIS